MRIRKRFPPPSASSLPLSDPHGHRSLLVQQQEVHPNGNPHVQEVKTDSQLSDPPNQPLRPPSDQQSMIGHVRTSYPCSDAVVEDEKKVNQKEELEGKEIKSNDTTRKESILGAEAGSEVLPSSTSSHQVFGGWFGGDQVIPFKKRRGSFVRRAVSEKMTSKMKSKTNKKCVQEINSDEQEGKGSKEGIEIVKKNTTKRGSVIMEGSRCSRVNGRGWRCCQQTLVGYSLCEHHLGKGRLRSMTSVRSRGAMANTTVAAQKGENDGLILPVQEKKQEEILMVDDNDDDHDGEMVPMMVTKKRMKLGMVKARSIRSLLGQTDNAVVVDDDNKNRS